MKEYDMNVFIMRHGTTNWNEKGIIQGRSKNRLSKDGIALTKQVARNWKDKKLDLIYCSPLTRAVQTANIMNSFHNVKIVKNENLTEVNQGIFTGRAKNSLTDKEKFLRNSRDKNCGIESYEDLYKRVKTFVEFLKSQKYKNVLIITHNIVASFISYMLEDVKIDFENYQSLRYFKNAEIKSFKL